MKEQKTLFVHKLFSKAAAHYLKLIHELFDLDEKKVWEQVCDVKQNQLKNEARQRFFDQQKKAYVYSEDEDSKVELHFQRHTNCDDTPFQNNNR